MKRGIVQTYQAHSVCVELSRPAYIVGRQFMAHRAANSSDSSKSVLAKNRPGCSDLAI